MAAMAAKPGLNTVKREYDKYEDMEIIEDTNTADVVRHLAAIDLTKNRCHRITEDAPPDVDPLLRYEFHLEPFYVATAKGGGAAPEARATSRAMSGGVGGGE